MENPPWMKMYVLFKIQVGMLSNVMLIFRGVTKMDLPKIMGWNNSTYRGLKQQSNEFIFGRS